MDPGCAKAFVAIATAATSTRGAGMRVKSQRCRGPPPRTSSRTAVYQRYNDSGVAAKLALITNGDGVRSRLFLGLRVNPPDWAMTKLEAFL